MYTCAKLKEEWQANKDLSKVLEMLKEVTALQLHSTEQLRKGFPRYIDAMKDSFDVVSQQVFKHPFLIPATETTGVLAITSDIGLLGGLDATVLGAAMKIIRDKKFHMMVVGRKGKEYMLAEGISATVFPGWGEKFQRKQLVQIANYITEETLNGNIGEVFVVYPRFISFGSQKIDALRLLPLERPEQKDISPDSELIIEPSPKRAVEYLARLWIEQQLHRVFCNSKLSELSARFFYLEAGYLRLMEEGTKLKFRYYRAVHESMDKSIREIFAARRLWNRG